jgi:signal recognition particle GTPase
MDGDSRGGAALSVRQITGAPIKFAGVSEKLDGLEQFDAERHAGRILGMGDILALVEQVTAGVDMEAAQKLAAKVKSGTGFDLNDFLAQIQQMKQMGGLSSLMDKLPTQLAAKAGNMDLGKAEKDIARKQGIIHSMTPKERSKPELIKATRKRRIAAGAGVQVQEVNRLLKEFEQMQDMMKKMSGGGSFDLNDFLAQIQQMKQMGGLSSLMDKLPSQLTAKAGSMDMDKVEKDIGRKQGIIHSMTPLERRKPDLIKATRKRRIAAGAGVHVQEVNRLLNEFEQMQGMMKKMKGSGMMKMMKRMGGMKGMPKMPF